ncbi:MAG TPA: cupin domain-containing protein, partial [Roseiarcus sp.]|nr:cupin domain-containing protein [Roseiarcus sp.]
MIAQPDHLTVRPDPTTAGSMDPLSDVLRAVRLTGGVFLSGCFTAPWCIDVKITAEECARRLPGRPAQIIGFHVVIEGRMLVRLDGEPPVEVSAGEIVLFPQNDPHVLADRRGLRPISASELIERPPDGGLYQIVHGGGGVTTRIVCGFLASEDSCNPLFSTLPKALKIDVRGAASREWIEASVRFAAHE